MKSYISMLRGINVSGQKMIRMLELKAIYESLGFSQVETYVQSGNVVFNCAEQDRASLAALIAAQIERSFGFAVAVFMRDTAEFQRISESNPFVKRNEDPAKLHVTFLQQPPTETDLRQLEIPKGETDELFVGPREIFLFCPNGYGRTKLSNNFFERKLKSPATTRNWKTVNTLLDLVKSRSRE
jgi:uncharacterized protein (DUF1697 family)